MLKIFFKNIFDKNIVYFLFSTKLHISLSLQFYFYLSRVNKFSGYTHFFYLQMLVIIIINVENVLIQEMELTYR